MTLRSLFAALGACLFVLVHDLAAAAEPPQPIPEVQALMKQGQYPAALEQVDKVLAVRPKDPQARFAKGIILTELNRPGDAIVVYQKLIEDFPELPEPYNNLAVIYASQKQFDKARAALELAIRTHPAYATAHENLGDIYAKLASQAYDKALQLDSDNVQAQQKLATIRDLMSYGTRGTRVPPVIATTKPVVVATAPSAPKVEPKSEPKVEAKPAKPESQVSKPAEAKPEPKPEAKPVPPKPDNNGIETAVRKAVDGWANAWSQKSVSNYLAYYGPEFSPPKGMSRKDWEAERRDRLNKPGPIEVELEGLNISLENGVATARFRQRYSSNNLKTSTSKALVLTQRNGRWLIQQERIGR